VPCPPRPKRIRFRELDQYKVLADRVTQRPGYQVTLQDVEDLGFISSKVAQAIYTDLGKDKDMNTMEVPLGSAASPVKAASVYQREQQIINAIVTLRDAALEKSSNHFGKLFYELQQIHAKPGRSGKFAKRVEELGFNKRSVYRWIDDYRSTAKHEKRTNKSCHGVTISSDLTDGLGLRGGLVGNAEAERESCGALAPNLEEDKEYQGRAPLEPAIVADVSETDHQTAKTAINALDTPEGRSDWLFKHALDVFERSNRVSGQALHEWDEAAARVRNVLASYKKDEVDNANADFSPIAVGEED
jgi:hypothetical protein